MLKRDKLALQRLLKIIHFTIASLFWVVAILTIYSFLSKLGEESRIFLTAPIGLKPEEIRTSFGEALNYLLVVSIVLWLVKAVTSRMKQRWIKPLAERIPPPPLTLQSLDPREG